MATSSTAAPRLRPSFADFIRKAKAGEKKRVYTAALAEAARSQNELLGIAAAQQQRTASPA